MMKNKIKKQVNRFLFSIFKKLYNPENKLYLDFVNDEWFRVNKNWHSFPVYSEDFLLNWSEYYLKNKNEMKTIFSNFNKNLDETSIDISRALWERNVFLLPKEKRQDIFLFNVDQLYTAHEKSEQANFNFQDPQMWQQLGSYYKHGFYYIEEIVKDYIKDKDFIDGGAFNGDSSFVLDYFEPNKIFAFEPSVENFNLLEKNVTQKNFIKTIIPVNKGLYNKTTILNFEGKDISFKFSDKQTDNCIKVVSIDDFARENNADIGLIKLDVEGAEYEVIEGALQTIQKNKPVLAVSVYHHPKDLFETKSLIEKITANKYKFMIRTISPYSLNTDIMLLAYPVFLER